MQSVNFHVSNQTDKLQRLTLQGDRDFFFEISETRS